VGPAIAVHVRSSMSGSHVLELADAAESGGIGELWLAEDMFFRGATPTAAAIAAVTSEIRIGLGVVTPWARHPAIIAMEVATLMDFAGPRLTLGIGAGVRHRISSLGVNYREPVIAVREAVSIVRNLLSGKTVSSLGKVFSVTDLALSMPPNHPSTPLFVAAVGSRALHQAGEIADGVLLSIMSSVMYVRSARERVSAGAQEAGRVSSPPLVVYVPFATSKSTADAYTQLKPTLARYFTRWANVPYRVAYFAAYGPLQPERLSEIVSRLKFGEAPEAVVSDELVATYCIGGTLKDCRRKLAGYRDAGAATVVLNPVMPLADPTQIIAEVLFLSSDGKQGFDERNQRIWQHRIRCSRVSSSRS